MEGSLPWVDGNVRSWGGPPGWRWDLVLFFFLLKTMMTSRIGRLVIKVVLGCNIGLRNFECQNLLYSETEGLIRSVMLGETGLFQAERHYYKSEFCRWPKRGFLVW